MKYDLAELIGRKTGSALVPVIAHSPALELGMLKAMRKVIAVAARGIADLLVPRYVAKRAVADGETLVRDADEDAFSIYRAMVHAAVGEASSQVAQLLDIEARRHTKTFLAQAERAFGVNLRAIVKKEDLGDWLDAATLRNAGLIRGMADDLIKQVQSETVSALLEGKSAANLRTVLQERLAVSDSRARLIARDQTAKATSDLNRKRHQDAGITHYVWRTSQDERVRSRHRPLDGKVYEYGKPTGAEDGLPPGQPIQCRCIAQAVVEFDAVEKKRTTRAKLKASVATLPHPDAVVSEWNAKAFAHLPAKSPYIKAAKPHMSTLQGMVSAAESAGKRAYYTPSSKRISMDAETLDDPRGQEVWRHEFAHHIDREMGTADNGWAVSTRALPSMYDSGTKVTRSDPYKLAEGEGVLQFYYVQKDRRDALISKVSKKSFNLAEWKATHPTRSTVTDSEAADLSVWYGAAFTTKHPQFLLWAYPHDHMLADFVGAVTDNKVGYGHDAEYYRVRLGNVRAGNLGVGHAMEAFANYYAIAAAPDQARITAIRAIFPKVAKEFDAIIKEAATWNPQ